MSTSRRQLLIRGAGAAGAAAVPAALLAAAPALAQEDAQTDELERLIGLENAAVLAYGQAADVKGLDAEAQTLFEAIGGQEADHSEALGSAVDQLGVDPPDASNDPADYEELNGLDAAKTQTEILDFLITFEESLVTAYLDASQALEDGDLITTGGQVGASHTQHLVALRLLRGDSPDKATELPG